MKLSFLHILCDFFKFVQLMMVSCACKALGSAFMFFTSVFDASFCGKV